MIITLHYYAMLREKAGVSTETVDTSASTVSTLFEELDQTHHFGVNPARIRVAINNEMAEWNSPLSDDDHITFIPPTAGG